MLIHPIHRMARMIKTADVDKILQKHHNDKTALISILQDIQAKNRWLPQEILEYVSEKLKIPLIDVYSTVTFYKSFSLTPRGKHIVTVCLGTACHVRGSPKILDELKNQLDINVGETTPDENFTLQTVRCLGVCALGPLMTIDDEYYGQVTTKIIPSILKKYKKRVQESDS